jgi:hypothetical protein
MQRDEYRALVNEAARKRVKGGLSGCAAAVEYLRKQLDRVVERDDRWDIYGLIASEYELVADHAQSSATYAERAKEFPDNPVSLATLAEAAARAGRPPSEVVDIVDRALALAIKQDRLVRVVLRTRAEIAHMCSDKLLMEDTVRRLINDGAATRVEDIATPGFVKQLAENMGIDPYLIARL